MFDNDNSTNTIETTDATFIHGVFLPEEIRHLVSEENTGRTRQEAIAEGKKYYIGKPDPNGCPFRRTNRSGILFERDYHRRYRATAKGKQSQHDSSQRYQATAKGKQTKRAAHRRYYNTPKGYTVFVVNAARARIQKAGLPPRPIEEELFLIEAMKASFALKSDTGKTVHTHHCIRERRRPHKI